MDEDSKVSAAFCAQPRVARCLSHGGCSTWCFQTPRAVPTSPGKELFTPKHQNTSLKTLKLFGSPSFSATFEQKAS